VAVVGAMGAVGGVSGDAASRAIVGGKDATDSARPGETSVATFATPWVLLLSVLEMTSHPVVAPATRPRIATAAIAKGDSRAGRAKLPRSVWVS
jgi:hypothetical protein